MVKPMKVVGGRRGTRRVNLGTLMEVVNLSRSLVPVSHRPHPAHVNIILISMTASHEPKYAQDPNLRTETKLTRRYVYMVTEKKRGNIEHSIIREDHHKKQKGKRGENRPWKEEKTAKSR